MPSRRRTRSSRQRSGSKRYSIEADSAYSPGLSSAEMKGRPTSYGLRRQYSDTVELMMECQEEELLPAQIEAFKREVEEYKEARRKIKAAKDEQMRLEQQQLRQQKLQHQQIAAAPQQNAVSPSSANSQADVVIVGESPPKQMAAAQPAVSTAARLLNPTPQQVYKFVNVPGQTPTSTGNQWVIRPLMQVMPQQNVGNSQIQPRNQAVNIQKSPFMPKRADSFQNYPQGQFPPQGLQVSNIQGKRPLQYPQYVNPPKKKPRRLEADDIGTLVPLDEYYYGKKEGDPTYQEEKGEHRFKCWYCSKMLYNNVKTMMHMQGHIDSEKQQNLDLSDLTQCKHCYKQFDTPFEMQTHIEKVHMNNTNVLLCRICEKDHESRQSLTSHMRQNHNACEMPYICQLCHFRSSMYSDVVDHFKKKHENSECLLCLYCLKVFHVKFVSQGWGQTQNYYHHLLRHQSKTNAKKCQLCKLTFFNAQDVKAHRKKDHMPNQKGVIGMNAKYTTPDQVMIRVPESGLQPKQLGVKSLNAPAVSKVSEHRGLRYPRAVQELRCFECKMIMATTDHYKKYIQCSMCRFATSCSFAYANHMMGFHSGQITSLSLNIPWERSLPAPMYCLCGFGSRYGNTIANHLVFCTKRSCYKEKPILPPKEDRVDEEQDPRRRPGASLLDVLGLVKKPNIVSKKRFTSAAVSEKAIPQDDQEEPRDPSIPPELTGARRWLTVKLKDDKTPSKASVFGADDSNDRAFSPEPEDNSNDATNIDSLVNSALAHSEEDEEEPSGDKDKGDEVIDTMEDSVHAEDEGEKGGEKGNEPDKDEDEESEMRESENLEEDNGERSIDKEEIQSSDKESGEKDETSEQEPDSDKDTKEVEKVSDEKAEEGIDTSVAKEKDTREAEEGSDKETEEGIDTSVFEETKGAKNGSDKDDEGSDKDAEESSYKETQEGIDTSVVEEKNSEEGEEGSDKETEEGIATSVAEETKGAKNGSDKDDEGSDKDAEESSYKETEEDMDSSVAENDEPEEKVLEDSESPQPDNQPLTVDEPNAHPVVSEAQQDSEAAQAFSEPEVDKTLPESGVSETFQEMETSAMQPKPETSEPQSDAEDSETQPGSEEQEPVSEVSKTVDEGLHDSPAQPDAEEDKQEDMAEDVTEGENEEASRPETSSDMDTGDKDDGETVPNNQETSVSQNEKPLSKDLEESKNEAVSPGTQKESSGRPEEGEQLTSGDKDTGGPEDPESCGETGDRQPAHLPPSQPPSAMESKDSTKDSKLDSAKAPVPSDPPRFPNKPHSQERSRDRDRSHDHYRDRSDERDRYRSHDRDRDRSYDHDRSRDRGYERDRDRREQHRSDRDRYGGHGGGHRYDDRRYPNDNRNYNRYQGGHDRNQGGYHGNQHQGGYRDNYGNQRDRYGQNRGQGYHGNRDYRGRGGYRGNY